MTSFWRKEDPVLACPACEKDLAGRTCPECEIQGRIRVGGMFGHQREWWNLPNKIKLLVTGYGGGKTITCCKRAVSSALQNAPAPVAIVSPTFPMARETIMATMNELLAGRESLDPKRFSWSLMKSPPPAYTITDGATTGRIIVYSGEDPLKLKGPNLAAAFIDEPFIQDYEVFEQMSMRVRHPAARFREIGLTGTPEQLNWGYDLADPQGDLHSQNDVGVVQASTDANLAIGSDYLEQMEGSLTGKLADAYRHGHFVNLAKGAIYYSFRPEEHMRAIETPDVCEWGIGMDFGSARSYASMAAVVFWRTEDHIHIVAEFEQANSDTPTMCATLRNKFPQVHHVYPDATGNRRQSASGISDFKVLREHAYAIQVGSINPPIRDRYNSVNWMLESGRLTFEPRCKLLRKYLSQLSYETYTKQKQMTHLTDAMGYPIYRIFPPIPTGIERAKLGRTPSMRKLRIG